MPKPGPVILVDYGSFNDAVAEEMFGADKAGRPVYLLPDAATYESIFKRAGAAPGGEGHRSLHAAVRSTLAIDVDGIDPFHRHRSWCLRDRRDPLETPPSLSLLVVLSAAADVMHAGDGMAANNYYGRLLRLLDVPDWRQPRVKSAYQSVAEDLWGSLNAWLEAWEGERGVPTAYAVGQRFIGLPMSQALVRQHDRERLTQVFAAEGLPPGYQMAAADMEGILDAWVNRQPSVLSNALRILWSNATARERIAGVACLELEAWRGEDSTTQTSQGSSRYAAVRLMAQIWTFPRPSVELNLTVPTPAGEERPLATLAAAEGPVRMRLTPLGPGSLRLDDARQLDAASLIADEVSLTIGDASQPMTRLPRRVVPMRFDDLHNCYIEVERVQLGEQSLVWTTEALTSRIDDLLAVVARPGWSSLTSSTPGVPDGWVVYRGVQVFDRFAGSVHVDLQPLLPRSSASLVLSGGFTVPGRMRKWSSLDPPEVQAVTPQASRLKVRVDAGNRLGEVVLEQEVAGSVAIVSLADARLPDGEYVVTLWVDDAKKPAASSVLRLRSGDSPVREAAGRSRLAYRPSFGGLWPLSACESDGSPDIEGARVEVPQTGQTRGPMPPARQRARPPAATAGRRLVRVGRGLGDDSCMRTGLHRFELPPVLPGRPLAASIQGECVTCGLVRRFAGTPYGARKRPASALPSRQHLGVLPPVADNDDRDHAVAFDVLCHVGSGSASDFARIATQVEGTALFVDVLLRTLEVLGHIDVQRDPGVLSLKQFELTPPTLVEVDADTWWLVGRAPNGLVGLLRDAVEREGGTLEEGLDAGVPRRLARCSREQLDQVTGGDERLDVVKIVASAGLALALALPPLSTIAVGLPRSPVPAFDSLAKWDTTSAHWAPATSIAHEGAYRLGGFTPLYGVRSPADLQRGTIAFGGPQLVKHIAALWAADPLAGYHAASSSVVVPLGCDLPSLYGRALALCSGKAPVALEKSRMLQYPRVPQEVAALMHTALSC